MKLIPLSQGQFAQVDDEDFDWLNQWKWCADYNHGAYYARRTWFLNGKCYHVAMHREIMKTPKGIEVDHADLDGLNNQEYNIRNCNHGQNMAN